MRQTKLLKNLKEISAVLFITLLIAVSVLSVMSVSAYIITVNWTEPEIISNKDDYDDHRYAMILDETDNLHVVWCEYYADNWEIKYRQLNAISDNWSDITTLSVSALDVKSLSPILRKDSQGVIHLIWKDRDYSDGTYYQKYRYYTEESWSEIVTLTELNITSNYYDFVPISDSELFFVHDSNYNTSNHEVYYQTYNWVTQTYGSSYQLTNSTQDIHYPSVVVDTQQTVHVSWTDLADPTHRELHYQSFNGTWSPNSPLVISQIDNLHTSRSKIYADGNDNIHFLYTESEFPYYELHYRVLADDILGTDHNLQSGETVPVDHNIFIDSDNTIHFVWSSYTNDLTSRMIINYQQMLTDGSWSNTLQYLIEIQSGGTPINILDSEGVMHIIWSAYVENDWCIYYIGCDVQSSTSSIRVMFPIALIAVSIVIITITRKNKFQ
ncbi:MAG: hypothetical protein ACTSSH_03155 [Candidatus Heimdallarchaeota archaeon]